MPPSRSPWASLATPTILTLLATTALAMSGCGGSKGNSSPVSSADASVNNTVNGVTYDLGLNLNESNISNTGSGVDYQLTITNNGSSAVTIPAYVDTHGATHPTYVLTVDTPSGTDYTFGTSVQTANTTLTIQPGSSFPDTVIVGPQYLTNNGTYDGNETLTYAPSTTVNIGTVTLDIND